MRRIVCLLIAVFFAAFATRADAPSAPGEQRLFVGAGRVLTIGEAKQLTFGAHVGQFLFQPGSLEAAYSGVQTDGETVTVFVRLMGLKHGETFPMLSWSATVREGVPHTAYSLGGWSGDGRYLMVQHAELGTATETAPARSEDVWECVDVGVSPFKVRRVPLPDGDEGSTSMVDNGAFSPSGRLFALQGTRAGDDPRASPLSVFVYNLALGTVRRVPLPAGSYPQGWVDDGHLLLSRSQEHKLVLVARDIVTGRETPTKAEPAALAPVPRAFPAVRLSLLPLPVALSGPGALGQARANALWLTIQGPKPHLPPVCLGVGLRAGAMQGALAPDQSTAVWTEHGDLFACVFGERDASLRERYDAGDALSCDEERRIAESNVKQVGLSLLQYSQDYDEQYPPAGAFTEGVRPYLRDTRLLAVGSHEFAYAPPPDLSAGHLAAPAETVLGTLRLPCATVTLYADGSVHSLPPPEKAAPAAE